MISPACNARLTIDDIIAVVAKQLGVSEHAIRHGDMLYTVRIFTWSLLHRLGWTDTEIATAFPPVSSEEVGRGRQHWEEITAVAKHEPRIMDQLIKQFRNML